MQDSLFREEISMKELYRAVDDKVNNVDLYSRFSEEGGYSVQ